MSTITLQHVRSNPEVQVYIESANQVLNAMGYTEHGLRHADIVAKTARMLCTKLGYSHREAELAAIAGFLHDIGNMINREDHAQVGSVIVLDLLRRMGMDPEEIALIVSAIGNHEETSGHPVNYATAAVILADKSDVHRSRVQNPNPEEFDIHDRVNHAAQSARLHVHPEEKVIVLELTIDTREATVIEYFEIFLDRMVMCRKAAQQLNCHFHLVINGVQIG